MGLKDKRIWKIYRPGAKTPINARLSKRLKGAKGANMWLFRILAEPKTKSK